MKKTITTENGTTHISGGKSQEVKHNLNGSSYVTYNGRRLSLDNFVRTNDKDSAVDGLNDIHGIYGMSYFSAYAIRLSSDGETAQVFYIHW